MVEILNSSGKVIRTSCDLRGLSAHMRRVRVKSVYICRTRDPKEGGKIRVVFKNGDTCQTVFASFAVMCDFVRTRKRFQGTEFQLDDYPYNYDTVISRRNVYLCSQSYPFVGAKQHTNAKYK